MSNDLLIDEAHTRRDVCGLTIRVRRNSRIAAVVWSAWVSVNACPASLRTMSGVAQFRGIIRSKSPWIERTGQVRLSTPAQSMIMRPKALICAAGQLLAISMRHVSASLVSGAKRQRTNGRHERKLNTKSGMRQSPRFIRV